MLLYVYDTNNIHIHITNTTTTTTTTTTTAAAAASTTTTTTTNSKRNNNNRDYYYVRHELLEGDVAGLVRVQRVVPNVI